MASNEHIADLRFEKSWMEASDFPTYQPNETFVRADLQYFPDVLRDYLNKVVLPEMQRMDDEIDAAVDFVSIENGHLKVILSDGTRKDLGAVFDNIPKLVINITYDTGKHEWTVTYSDATTIKIPREVNNLSQLAEDETHRLITDAERTAWNAMMPVAGGTFTGVIKAGAENQAPAESLLRNIKLVNDDTEPTVPGEIVFHYK